MLSLFFVFFKLFRPKYFELSRFIKNQHIIKKYNLTPCVKKKIDNFYYQRQKNLFVPKKFARAATATIRVPFAQGSFEDIAMIGEKGACLLDLLLFRARRRRGKSWGGGGSVLGHVSRLFLLRRLGSGRCSNLEKKQYCTTLGTF